MSTKSCRGGVQAGRQLWRPLLDQGRKQRRMAGFLVCATKPSWRTAVEDAKSWRHGRRAASRAVRRLRQERRLGSRRGGGYLPTRGVLAVFSKPATYPGFADPPKPRTGSSSPRRHRGEDFDSKKEPWPSDESLYLFRFCPYWLSSLVLLSRDSLVFSQGG